MPQLAASTLMDVASATEDDLPTMRRLAAGGFRDMTRIAAGHPGIWPDILSTNREAVLHALDAYVAALLRAREIVESGARVELIALLERARAARRNLPAGVSSPTTWWVPGARAGPRGVLAEVRRWQWLGVSISTESAHSLEAWCARLRRLRAGCGRGAGLVGSATTSRR